MTDEGETGAPGVRVVFRPAGRGDAAHLVAISAPYVASGALLPRSPEYFAEHAAEFRVLELDGVIAGTLGLRRMGDG